MPADTSVPIGTEATLKCVTSSRVEKCTWTWKPLHGNEPEIVVQEYSSNGDLGRDCSLKLPRVYTEKQGQWACQVSISSLNTMLTSPFVKLTVFEQGIGSFLSNLLTFLASSKLLPPGIRLRSIFRRSEVLRAFPRHPNISRRKRFPPLCDLVGRGTVSMVPDAGEFKHHGSSETVSGCRKRGQGLQRQVIARTRGTRRTMDLWRQVARQTELYGRASGQVESPGTRYHRILRRIRDIPFLSWLRVYRKQSIVDPQISDRFFRLAIFVATLSRGRRSAIVNLKEYAALAYIMYILTNCG